MNLERDILKCNHTREPKGGMIEVNDGERLTCHVGEDSSQSKPLGMDAYQPLGWIQRVGQLEHIITEHVEISVRVREASWESGKHNHSGAGLFSQELRNPLAQLNFRNNDLDPVIFDLRYKAVKMKRRWLAPRLGLDRPNDLEPKAPREVWPGRVMGDEAPIGHA
jgi:hypothetical protein